MGSPAQSYILALDHGTSGCKVALVSMHGKVLDHAFRSTPTHFFEGGGAEQNPEDWWQGFLEAAQEIYGRQSEAKSKTVAVCVSSTFSTTVAVNKRGQALMPAITWMDSRGAPIIKKMVEGPVKVQGYDLFKMLRWVRITGGGPSLSGKDDIAHVLLIKEKFPEIYEQTEVFLGSKDYLNMRLCGEKVGTYDSVALFWLTDNRNINNIRYSDDLIRIVGIDRSKLPLLSSATDKVGTLLPSVAEKLGLNTHIPVFGGAPDHQSAQIGAGATKDFQGHLYIGTSSWLECIVPFKKTDVFHNIASLPSAIPGKYQCINEQDIAGGALSWLLDKVVFHQSEFYQPLKPDNPYAKLDQTVANVPAGCDKLIFAPWLNGERTPVDSTTLKGMLFNLSLRSNADYILRSVMEGVALNTRWNLQFTEKFIGQKMPTLNMIGGGALSEIWCQIFADVLQRIINRVEDPLQANARGAAYIASVGLGEISFDDVPELTPCDKRFEPNMQNRAIYDELYQALLEIYRKNISIFNKLNG